MVLRRNSKKGWVPAAAFLASVLALVINSGAVLACGIHDPALLAKGSLNHFYPNALWVTGAIQKARRDGELPPIDRTRLQARGDARKMLDRVAFANTLSGLHALGVEVQKRNGRKQQPDVAMVVLDTMLWTRFSSRHFDVRQGLHVEGPAPGDLVLVTDEPVVQAIYSGSMSVARAVELGVVRIYASEWERGELLDRIGSIGEVPLQPSRFFPWSYFDSPKDSLSSKTSASATARFD